jgi:CheY-like chemotaxis protein
MQDQPATRRRHHSVVAFDIEHWHGLCTPLHVLGQSRSSGAEIMMGAADVQEHETVPSRVRVLIVDDDFEFRYAIADALRSLGWEVRGAADGSDALGTLREWRPDVIMLDLILPIMDGWTFRLEAERQHALEGIPIVVTSGAADVRQEADKLKAAAALAKPFDLDELVRIIQELTDGKAGSVRPSHPPR